ncbi:MAG: TonB-dependent receptor [Bacteroidota bacterium]
MDNLQNFSTKEKALEINLRQDIYGSFAEIGAGQEVAANFFKAGGASGTVAKTMSAYDMSFSDAIYGTSERYVCEARLIKMLEKEYRLLSERLPHRAKETRFFAFANTVEALNYNKTNQAHGWIGVRFQMRPEGPLNECVIHIKMHDNDAILQQYAVGVVGVNLIYACLFHKEVGDGFLNSLIDELAKGRIEIDMFRIAGPDFKTVDNRIMSLKLVKNGMTRVAIFGADGSVQQPSEFLYKKNVLMLRGRFRPVTHVNVDMLISARRQFKKDPDVDKEKIVVLTELTLADLSTDGHIDEEDFLNRVDIICSLGQNVMISNYIRYYRLVNYISAITRGRKIGIILGVYNLQKVFDENYYQDLKGGVLEAFGTLFGNNVTLYVYPSYKQDSQELYGLQNFQLPDNLQGLLDYLRFNKKLVDIDGPALDHLHIISDNVLARIKSGEGGWEGMVPRKVSAAIKEKKLFGYKD